MSCGAFDLGLHSHPLQLHAHGTTSWGRSSAALGGAAVVTLPDQPTASHTGSELRMLKIQSAVSNVILVFDELKFCFFNNESISGKKQENSTFRIKDGSPNWFSFCVFRGHLQTQFHTSQRPALLGRVTARDGYVPIPGPGPCALTARALYRWD